MIAVWMEIWEFVGSFLGAEVGNVFLLDRLDVEV
jgi:hypothetical protein